MRQRVSVQERESVVGESILSVVVVVAVVVVGFLLSLWSLLPLPQFVNIALENCMKLFTRTMEPR